MPIIDTNTKTPLGADATTIDEIETGTGYQIRSSVPKFESKPTSMNTPNIPSEGEVAKLFSESDSIAQRAKVGERQALEAAQIHRDLKLQAEQMRDSTSVLEREALNKEKALLFEREQLRKEEAELEQIRAAKHNDVLQKEALRAQARADVLLQQKKRDYAQQLIARHQDGCDIALAEVQRFQLEKQEADLLRQRAELLRARKLPAASYIPTEIRPIKVMVDVQPENIPEAHVVSQTASKGARAGSIIGTRMIPEKGIMSDAVKQAQKTEFTGKLKEATQTTVTGKKTFAGEIEEQPVKHNWEPEDFIQSSV
jgi:hypothetical protein